MPQLHETQMGQKFYNVQLPKLIDALEKIANNQSKVDLAEIIKTQNTIIEKQAETIKEQSEEIKKLLELFTTSQSQCQCEKHNESKESTEICQKTDG